MNWLPDGVVDHLRKVIEEPDLSETRYVLEKEIGRGGMGVVYLARDTTLDRSVALKVVSNLDTSEAKTLAQLEHPGIVPVHDSGVLPDGRTYYVMKFVQGTRLDQYAADRPPLPDLLRVISRICEAVAFAHARGILHRDLKPENVMLGSFGEVLVLDWGVAHVLSATPPGAVAGTRGYMSPEQASGAGMLDARSDIFSLGKILEYLVADGIAPKAIRAIARKAMDADRELRYPSALDLSADIARYLDGQPVSAHRESLLEQAARWVSHNRTLVALLITYVMVRVVIFLFTRH